MTDSALAQLRTLDHLKAGKNTTLLATIQKYNESLSEKVIWSDTVQKRNHRNSYQKRDLVVTTTAMYNFKKGSYRQIRRKMDIEKLEKIVVHQASKECLIKIHNEHDYWYKIVNIKEFLSVLAKQYNDLMGYALPMEASQDLKQNVTLKKDVKGKSVSPAKKRAGTICNESKSGVRFQGWLAKCGYHRAEKYLPRYFQLIDKTLLYHSARFKGSVKLNNAFLGKINYDDVEGIYKFKCTTPGKQLVLGSKNVSECEEWIKDLQEVSKDSKVYSATPQARASNARLWQMPKVFTFNKNQHRYGRSYSKALRTSTERKSHSVPRCRTVPPSPTSVFTTALRSVSSIPTRTRRFKPPPFKHNANAAVESAKNVATGAISNPQSHFNTFASNAEEKSLASFDEKISFRSEQFSLSSISMKPVRGPSTSIATPQAETRRETENIDDIECNEPPLDAHHTTRVSIRRSSSCDSSSSEQSPGTRGPSRSDPGRRPSKLSAPVVDTNRTSTASARGSSIHPLVSPRLSTLSVRRSSQEKKLERANAAYSVPSSPIMRLNLKGHKSTKSNATVGISWKQARGSSKEKRRKGHRKSTSDMNKARSNSADSINRRASTAEGIPPRHYREGFLLKEEPRTKKMRQRVFVLNEDTLSYFETELKGNIPLIPKESTVTATKESPSVVSLSAGFDFVRSGFKYRFTVGKADRLYKMAADTEMQLQQWLEALESVLNGDVLDKESKLMTSDLERYMKQEAPTGKVALVFTDVQSSTKLWENRKMEMAEAISLHDEILRRLLKQHRGYEVRTEGDAFFVVFWSAIDAFNWCFEAQLELLNAEWPEKLLDFPPAKCEEPYWSGVRVRMGVHVGKPNFRRNPVHGRMEYFGPVVNAADRIADSGHGGQVICTRPVVEDLEKAVHKGEIKSSLKTRLLGKYPYQGVKEVVEIFQVIHPRLEGRGVTAPGKFPELRIDWDLPNAHLATNYPKKKSLSKEGTNVTETKGTSQPAKEAKTKGLAEKKR